MFYDSFYTFGNIVSIVKKNVLCVFKASTGILFKSTEMFSGCLRVLIHCLMPTFREHCSSLHQDEKQPDTMDQDTETTRKHLSTFKKNVYGSLTNIKNILLYNRDNVAEFLAGNYIFYHKSEYALKLSNKSLTFKLFILKNKKNYIYVLHNQYICIIIMYNVFVLISPIIIII